MRCRIKPLKLTVCLDASMCASAFMFNRVRYTRPALRQLHVTMQIGSYYNLYGFRRFDAAWHLLDFSMTSEPSHFWAWLLIVSMRVPSNSPDFHVCLSTDRA